jgi:hypothetical protein
LKASEKVYWVKALLGLATGVICFYVQSSFDLQGQITLMLGTTLYIAFSEAVAIVFKVDRNRTIKIAIGAFLFLWMFTWTLLNTLGQFGWI